MQAKIKALEEKETWVLVPLPEDKRAIGCKWVYKTKFNHDDSLDKHKARLVEKDFSQTKGVDYEETFAPVSKMTTLRSLIAIGASKS